MELTLETIFEGNVIIGERAIISKVDIKYTKIAIAAMSRKISENTYEYKNHYIIFSDRRIAVESKIGKRIDPCLLGEILTYIVEYKKRRL